MPRKRRLACKVFLVQPPAARWNCGAARALRPLRGISIPETAAALSVSSKTIRDWECGTAHVPQAKRPMLASLLRVAQDLLCERIDPAIPPEAAAPGGASLDATSSCVDGGSKPKIVRTARAPAAPSRSTVFVVELLCLLCARELGTLESSVWPTAAPRETDETGCSHGHDRRLAESPLRYLRRFRDHRRSPRAGRPKRRSNRLER